MSSFHIEGFDSVLRGSCHHDKNLITVNQGEMENIKRQKCKNQNSFFDNEQVLREVNSAYSAKKKNGNE
ncbi:MAG: hypothetical protein AAFY76_23405 [Cyanobacteria bacterium J06649_11]